MSADALLQDALRRMTRLQSDPTIAGVSYGVPEWDARLWRLGREWMPPAPGPHHRGSRSCDVYVATQVYEIGGHTALLGDLVRARPHAEAHLIVTDVLGQNPPPLQEVFVARLGVPRERITVLDEPTLEAPRGAGRSWRG
ncbi:MAG: hypothetical protein R2712_07490 [Vicinamibacterales bacterium]